MMNTEINLRLLLWLAASFLAGSIPWGYIIVKLFFKEDIRKLGSGNIGFTNVYRMYGWTAGLSCFILDIFKGLVPVIAATISFGLTIGKPDSWTQACILMVVGIAAILGHVFSPWLKFRGGKGIATALGVLIGLIGWMILIPLAMFLLVMLPTRYVSLGSLTGALTFTVMTFIFKDLFFYWPLGVLVFCLVVFTHRQNVKRLLSGSESRFNWKKNKI
jgi:acyl phosphate:glycerol-3-phosphate acyltransferase